MASLRPLKTFVVSPKVKHTATVIFLHGLGDSGAGWLHVAKMMQGDPNLGHIKWILPNAPPQKITLNFGMEMPAWFDIKSLDTLNSHDEDEAGMLASARSINEIITSEIDASPDVNASRIVLGGFSQGGAMTLFTGLTTERKLAGLAGLSTWLPLREKLKSMLTGHVKTLPIFLGHGTGDSVVAFKYGRASSEYLKNEYGLPTVEAGQIAGPGVRFEQYEGLDHGADPAEIDDFAEWLKVVVPQLGDR